MSKATTDSALGPSDGEKDARFIDHAAQSGASSCEHRHDGLAEEKGIRGIAEKYRRGDLRVIVELDPDPLVHLDDNAVGISINKGAKFPFKIKDVFIGPIEF
jgi:hypothetical protein